MNSKSPMNPNPINPNREAILTRLGNSLTPVSGDELARELGLSRAGIWKHIQSLRKQGVEIESYIGRGYQLKSDVLTPSMLLDRISTKRIGSHIIVLNEIDSTNREVMRRAESGADEGLVIIAEQQTHGRGRLGRSWHTAGDDSLAISILLRPDIPPEQVPQLSLLTAVALYQTLAPHVPEIRIKWPNDLLYHGAKMAGILTEMRAEPGQVDAVVLGAGLNIREPEHGWPKEIDQTVADLSSSSGKDISRLTVAAGFIQAVDRCYDIYLNHGFAPIRKLWWDAHAASGQLVRAHGHDGYVEGIAEALDEDGALLLRVDGELQRFIAGDLELINNGLMEPSMEKAE
ncbi:MAG: biotin--[acetyl-CoA-carboxylase] ligase [Mariprofundaceae bacterium]